MNELNDWFSEHRNQFLDVIIAGRVFGGRHGESPQSLRELEFDGSTVLIRFATTETLTIETPSAFLRGEYGQLIIPHASRIVFGWHYYGRDPKPENWCELIYEASSNQIQLTRTGPLMPGITQFNYTDNRIVELR
ncbi:MAG: hypothetical protein AAFN77_24465 [Planctomycetota bacterium]